MTRPAALHRGYLRWCIARDYYIRGLLQREIAAKYGLKLWHVKRAIGQTCPWTLKRKAA